MSTTAEQVASGMLDLEGQLNQVRATFEELRQTVKTLREENASLHSFKRSVDEAINSGDGSYRP